MSTKDGGPAFPTPGFNGPGDYFTVPVEGMSLRDWFAGQMLVGMHISNVSGREEWFARVAYAMSDAMLAARSKQEGGK